MKSLLCEDSMALGRAASEWCQEKLRASGAKSIFIPAGNTPVALYKIWNSEEPAYLRGVSLLQIDDVLTGQRRGMFREFFHQHLPQFAGQIHPIEKADQQADLAILGLGLNGHVAFHEPELGENFHSGCVRLSEVTTGNLGLDAGTWGISYGAAAFSSCKSILFMVGGAAKKSILKRVLEGDLSLPATRLLRHADVTLIADREALPEGVVRFGAAGGCVGTKPSGSKENELL